MQHYNAVHTYESSKHTMRIVYDDDTTDPLEYLDFGTMYLFHGRYIIGHAHGFRTPFEFFEHFDPSQSTMDGEPVLFLPVYIYDHSGVILSTTPFTCPWDSGQVGFTVVPVSKAKEIFGDDYVEKAENLLESEVKEYSDFLSGRCYGFIITDKHGNEVDSCYGILGYDNALDRGMDALKNAEQ